MTVLVVDDNIVNISKYGTTLTGIGHTVFTARNSSEAKTILERERIDAVLTDWGVPNNHGAGLLQWIHATIHPVPIIIVTTVLSSNDAQRQAFDAGADAYIIKQINTSSIKAVIREVEQIIKHSQI
jgi:CheY-like chemotaxis protein